ncbi:MAG TPA: zinc-ribbon domain-containing protein [Sphingomicrobium sp.]|jgi:predicted Zn finger-like uncharacterized protein
MILTCPECGTQYVVKDGAIPPGGRQVRCASCKHSWHQDMDEPAEPPEPRLPVETSEPVASEDVLEDTGQERDLDVAPAAAEMAEPPGYRPMIATPDPLLEESVDTEPDLHDSGYPQDDDFAPFGPRDQIEEPRRSGLLRFLLLVLLVAAAAIAFWFLAPAEWKSRLGLANASQTQLQLMMTHSDRQPLASGNELLAVTGRVINPTDETQPVPPIQARLLSSTGQLVYSWTIAPPARTLPPRQSATFNSAEVNVPSGGVDLALTLAPRV